MTRTLAAFSLAWLMAGCALRARPAALPPLASEGEVHLYVEPFPAEAERLTFAIAAISAVRQDGVEEPLQVVTPAISPVEVRNQRLLAWGRLTPGEYTGFHVKVASAAMAGEEGESALHVPSEPARIELDLKVSARRAAVVSLAFKYPESIGAGFVFMPAFSARIPPRTSAQLVGYGSSTAMASLTVFDKRLKRVTAVVPTGSAPQGVALDPVANRAYVALSGDDQVDVIDLASGESVGLVRLTGGDRPRDILLTPDRRQLLVTNPGSRTLSFVDPVSMIELSRVSVGEDPAAVLLDRTGNRAYVFNRRSNSITIVDVANRSVVATAPTDPEPLRGQVNRAGNRLYVIHAGSLYMSVFSLPDMSQASRAFVGLGASAIKVDARTDLVYVGRRDEGRVSVYDPFSTVAIDEFSVPDAVSYATIEDSENTLFLVVPARRSLVVVDLTSRQTIATIQLGEEPYQVAVVGERN